jgi:hypothetical protein
MPDFPAQRRGIMPGAQKALAVDARVMADKTFKLLKPVALF